MLLTNHYMEHYKLGGKGEAKSTSTSLPRLRECVISSFYPSSPLVLYNCRPREYCFNEYYWRRNWWREEEYKR